MIAAQGGIFGWVADSSALLSALSVPAARRLSPLASRSPP